MLTSTILVPPLLLSGLARLCLIPTSKLARALLFSYLLGVEQYYIGPYLMSKNELEGKVKVEELEPVFKEYLIRDEHGKLFKEFPYRKNI